MKWIKVAIGALIAVLSISIIATTVFKMTQPREVAREVSFEIDPVEGEYYPSSIYDEILEYKVINWQREVINIVSSYVNNEIVELFITIISDGFSQEIYVRGTIPSPDGDIEIDGYIRDDGNWIDDGSTLTDNFNIKLVFSPITQPPQLSGTNAILILLIPTVFAGGVILYFYKPFKKD